ncbi:MAG TPA: tetratricopeptide repeat protein [Thermoanaerobaculia bacterium]|nr:tetratricopeptide repeat protein [Thermoanaerobaculia bacterium]
MASANRARPSWAVIAAALAVAAALATMAGLLVRGRRGPETASGAGRAATPAGFAATAAADATYVGVPTCAGCHEAETEAWRGSHHDLAMQEVSEPTVLGDFDGARFEHRGVTTTFFRRDGGFIIQTDDSDGGALAEFEIAYTFGVTPLQQYLIAFPGGRYQALGIAWDSRPREQGGQRWFHLYPDAVLEAGDPLHWTGIDQNWNHMCAECHSTNLRKGYRAAEDRYETTWSELDVACEACHGPGSAHVEWARAAAGESREAAAARGRGPDRAPDSLGLVVRLDDRNLDGWEMSHETGTVRRTAPMPSRVEVESCARCHSRRGVIDERYVHGRPLHDTHRPALLDRGLYFADGQVRGEVYEYGSFLQSRMYTAGVTCSDCHDPHSLRLLAGGDALCARCHAPDRFAAESHHHHPAASPGARCVSCHMPERTYMVIDPRRDHSLRVPRPDLAASTAAPDACTGCHRDRDAAWAARSIESWHGRRERPPHWGEAIAAAWRGEAEADRRLLEVAADEGAPAIVRGTALSLLRDPASPGARAALTRAIADRDGLVRLGALAALDGAAIEERLALCGPLLHDPALAVRIDAARLLAPVPADRLGRSEAAARDAALGEYRAAQEIDADRPEAHFNLGNLALAQNDPVEAEREYREAVRIDPTFVPARVNLADVLRLSGRDAEAVRLLRDALARHGGDATLHHALGLALVRLGRHAEALGELERAAAAAPGEPRYAYVLAVALHSAGRSDEAIALLERTHERQPGDADVLAALASIELERGRTAAALEHARRLGALHPNDAGARALAAQIEGAAARE